MNDLNKQFLENFRTWGEFLNLHFSQHHDLTRERNELGHFSFLPRRGLVSHCCFCLWISRVLVPPQRRTQSLPWLGVHSHCLNYSWISDHLNGKLPQITELPDYAWLTLVQKRPLVLGSRVTLVSLCACPIRGWDLLSGQSELTKCTMRDLVTENLCTCRQRQLVSFELDFSITFLESHLIRNKKHSSLYQHHPAKCVQGGRSAFGQLSDCSIYIKMSKKPKNESQTTTTTSN